MKFEELLERVRDRVCRKVSNGEITERGFARQIGLSQSHTHNVLHGARIMTPATADRILEVLGLTLIDLLNEDELTRKPPGRSVLANAPARTGRVS